MDDEVNALIALSLQNGICDSLDLLCSGWAVGAGVASGAGRRCLGYCLSRLLAGFVLLEVTTVDIVAPELVVSDVQGLCLHASGIGSRVNAELVGKLLLKSVPVGELADDFGLRLVPLLRQSGETLVKVVDPLVLCNVSLLVIADETVNNFLSEGNFKDIVVLSI